MSWIDGTDDPTLPGKSLPRPPTQRTPQRSRGRAASASRLAMWWIGLGLVVGGAVIAWILWFVGDTPAGKTDTGNIFVTALGVVVVLLAVLGYGLYQDAAFQSGTAMYEPTWRPTAMAKIALVIAFVAGILHALRIADLVARLGLL